MKYLIIVVFGTHTLLYAQEVREIGASPGPLFGFGQNIIDKNKLIVSSYIEARAGSKIDEFEWDGLWLYGLTDRSSILASVAVVSSTVDSVTQKGLAGVLLQGEYALYQHRDLNWENQLTIVGSALFPTFNKGLDILGINSPGIFLGITASHNSSRWYAYASWAELTFVKRKQLLPGLGIFYEFGLGFPLNNAKSYYLSLIFECNGRYFKKTKIDGISVPDSGGNGIFFGPVLYFFYKGLTMEAGVQKAVVHNFFGQQRHTNYRLAFYASYTL